MSNLDKIRKTAKRNEESLKKQLEESEEFYRKYEEADAATRLDWRVPSAVGYTSYRGIRTDFWGNMVGPEYTEDEIRQFKADETWYDRLGKSFAQFNIGVAQGFFAAADPTNLFAGNDTEAFGMNWFSERQASDPLRIYNEDRDFGWLNEHTNVIAFTSGIAAEAAVEAIILKKVSAGLLNITKVPTLAAKAGQSINKSQKAIAATTDFIRNSAIGKRVRGFNSLGIVTGIYSGAKEARMNAQENYQMSLQHLMEDTGMSFGDAHGIALEEANKGFASEIWVDVALSALTTGLMFNSFKGTGMRSTLRNIGKAFSEGGEEFIEKGFGKGLAELFAESVSSKLFKGKVQQKIGSIILGGLGEGAEETYQSIIQQASLYNIDNHLKQIQNDIKSGRVEQSNLVDLFEDRKMLSSFITKEQKNEIISNLNDTIFNKEWGDYFNPFKNGDLAYSAIMGFIGGVVLQGGATGLGHLVTKEQRRAQNDKWKKLQKEIENVFNKFQSTQLGAESLTANQKKGTTDFSEKSIKEAFDLTMQIDALEKAIEGNGSSKYLTQFKNTLQAFKEALTNNDKTVLANLGLDKLTEENIEEANKIIKRYETNVKEYESYSKKYSASNASVLTSFRNYMSFYENMSNENLEELQDDLNRLGVKKTEGVKTTISTLTEKVKRLKSKAKDFTLSEKESKQIKTEIKKALSDLQKEVDQSELTVAQKSEVKEKSVKFVQTIAQVDRLAQGGGLSSPAAYIDKSHAESTMKAIMEETDYDKATLLFKSMDVAVLSQRQASFIYSHLQALANTEVEGKKQAKTKFGRKLHKQLKTEAVRNFEEVSAISGNTAIAKEHLYQENIELLYEQLHNPTKAFISEDTTEIVRDLTAELVDLQEQKTVLEEKQKAESVTSENYNLLAVLIEDLDVQIDGLMTKIKNSEKTILTAQQVENLNARFEQSSNGRVLAISENMGYISLKDGIMLTYQITQTGDILINPSSENPIVIDSSVMYVEEGPTKTKKDTPLKSLKAKEVYKVLNEIIERSYFQGEAAAADIVREKLEKQIVNIFEAEKDRLAEKGITYTITGTRVVLEREGKAILIQDLDNLSHAQIFGYEINSYLGQKSVADQIPLAFDAISDAAIETIAGAAFTTSISKTLTYSQMRITLSTVEEIEKEITDIFTRKGFTVTDEIKASIKALANRIKINNGRSEALHTAFQVENEPFSIITMFPETIFKESLPHVKDGISYEEYTQLVYTHELIHSATFTAIDKYYDEQTKSLKEDAPQSIKNLYAIWGAFRENLKESNAKYNSTKEALKSFKEFVAYLSNRAMAGSEFKAELEKLTKEQVVKDAGYKNIWEMISDALKDIFKSIFKIDENKYNALIDSQQNLLWFLSSDNIKPSEKEKTKTKVKETKVNSKKQTKKEPETEKENPIIRNEKKEDNKEINSQPLPENFNEVLNNNLVLRAIAENNSFEILPSFEVTWEGVIPQDKIKKATELEIVGYSVDPATGLYLKVKGVSGKFIWIKYAKVKDSNISLGAATLEKFSYNKLEDNIPLGSKIEKQAVPATEVEEQTKEEEKVEEKIENELFESNTELANAVYEALGFGKLKAKKADIERRRQEELKRITLDELKKEIKGYEAQLIPIEDKIGNSFRIIDASDGELTIDYIKQDGTSSSFSIRVSKEILDKYRNVEWSDNDINAKYDAELAVLEDTQVTPQQKQQALQLYSSYLQTTNNPTIEGFKQWNNRQQQIEVEEKKEEAEEEKVEEKKEEKKEKEAEEIPEIEEIPEVKEESNKDELDTLIESFIDEIIDEGKEINAVNPAVTSKEAAIALIRQQIEKIGTEDESLIAAFIDVELRKGEIIPIRNQSIDESVADTKTTNLTRNKYFLNRVTNTKEIEINSNYLSEIQESVADNIQDIINYEQILTGKKEKLGLFEVKRSSFDENTNAFYNKLLEDGTSDIVLKQTEDNRVLVKFANEETERDVTNVFSENTYIQEIFKQKVAQEGIKKLTLSFSSVNLVFNELGLSSLQNEYNRKQVEINPEYDLTEGKVKITEDNISINAAVLNKDGSYTLSNGKTISINQIVNPFAEQVAQFRQIKNTNLYLALPLQYEANSEQNQNIVSFLTQFVEDKLKMEDNVFAQKYQSFINQIQEDMSIKFDSPDAVLDYLENFISLSKKEKDKVSSWVPLHSLLKDRLTALQDNFYANIIPFALKERIAQNKKIVVPTAEEADSATFKTHTAEQFIRQTTYNNVKVGVENEIANLCTSFNLQVKENDQITQLAIIALKLKTRQTPTEAEFTWLFDEKIIDSNIAKLRKINDMAYVNAGPEQKRLSPEIRKKKLAQQSIAFFGTAKNLIVENLLNLTDNRKYPTLEDKLKALGITLNSYNNPKTEIIQKKYETSVQKNATNILKKGLLGNTFLTLEQVKEYAKAENMVLGNFDSMFKEFLLLYNNVTEYAVKTEADFKNLKTPFDVLNIQNTLNEIYDQTLDKVYKNAVLEVKQKYNLKAELTDAEFLAEIKENKNSIVREIDNTEVVENEDMEMEVENIETDAFMKVSSAKVNVYNSLPAKVKLALSTIVDNSRTATLGLPVYYNETEVFQSILKYTTNYNIYSYEDLIKALNRYQVELDKPPYIPNVINIFNELEPHLKNAVVSSLSKMRVDQLALSLLSGIHEMEKGGATLTFESANFKNKQRDALYRKMSFSFVQYKNKNKQIKKETIEALNKVIDRWDKIKFEDSTEVKARVIEFFKILNIDLSKEPKVLDALIKGFNEKNGKILAGKAENYNSFQTAVQNFTSPHSPFREGTSGVMSTNIFHTLAVYIRAASKELNSQQKDMLVEIFTTKDKDTKSQTTRTDKFNYLFGLGEKKKEVTRPTLDRLAGILASAYTFHGSERFKMSSSINNKKIYNAREQHFIAQRVKELNSTKPAKVTELFSKNAFSKRSYWVKHFLNSNSFRYVNPSEDSFKGMKKNWNTEIVYDELPADLQSVLMHGYFFINPPFEKQDIRNITNNFNKATQIEGEITDGLVVRYAFMPLMTHSDKKQVSLILSPTISFDRNSAGIDKNRNIFFIDQVIAPEIDRMLASTNFKSRMAGYNESAMLFHNFPRLNALLTENNKTVRDLIVESKAADKKITTEEIIKAFNYKENEQVKNKFEDFVEQVLNEGVQEQIERLKREDLLMIHPLEKTLMPTSKANKLKMFTTANNPEAINRYGQKTFEANLKMYLREYVYNQYIVKQNANATIVADMASMGAVKASKIFDTLKQSNNENNATAWEDTYKKVVGTELSKRAGGPIAPGKIEADANKRRYRSIQYKDFYTTDNNALISLYERKKAYLESTYEQETEEIKEIRSLSALIETLKKDNQYLLSSDEAEFINRIMPEASSFINVCSSDGFGMESERSSIETMYYSGDLTKELYDNAVAKLNAQVEYMLANNTAKVPNNLLLTQADLGGKVIQPTKQTYNGYFIETVREATATTPAEHILHYRYNKDSQNVLSPALISADKARLELRRLTMLAEYKLNRNNTGPYIPLTFVSREAVKSGRTNNSIEIWNRDGSFNDKLTVEDLLWENDENNSRPPELNPSVELSYEYKKTQTNFVNKYRKQKMLKSSMPTQAVKNLFSEDLMREKFIVKRKGKNQIIDGYELYKDFQEALINVYDSKFNNNFLAFLKNPDGSFNLTEENLQKFVSKILARGDQALYQEYKKAYANRLGSGNFNLQAFNALILEATKSVTALKLPGRSCVACSAAGINFLDSETGAKFSSNLDNIQAENLIINPNSSYKGGKLTWDPKTKRAQVIMPGIIKTKDGQILELVKTVGDKIEYNTDFIEQKNGKYYLNTKNISEEFLTGIFSRIPNSGLLSMVSFEVAAFLPSTVGDVIYVPDYLMTQTGFDFDGDKWFLLQQAHIMYREEGQLKYLAINEENTEKITERLNRILGQINRPLNGAFLKEGVKELKSAEDLVLRENADHILRKGNIRTVKDLTDLAGIDIEQSFIQELEEEEDNLATIEKRQKYFKYLLTNFKRELKDIATQNKVIQIFDEVLSAEAAQDRIRKELSFESFKKEADMFREAEAANPYIFSPLNISYQDYIARQAAAAGIAIGSYSNLYNYNSFMNEYYIAVDRAIERAEKEGKVLEVGDIISYTDAKNQKFGQQEFNNKFYDVPGIEIGEFTTNLLPGFDLVIDPYSQEEENQKPIEAEISGKQNVALDNQKYDLVGPFGITKETMPIDLFLTLHRARVASIVNKKTNKKHTAHFSHLLFNQPAVKSYTDKLKTGDFVDLKRTYSPAKEAFKEIGVNETEATEIIKNIETFIENNGLSLPMEAFAKNPSLAKIKRATVGATAQKMADVVFNAVEEVEKNNIQKQALILFICLQEYAKGASKDTSATNFRNAFGTDLKSFTKYTANGDINKYPIHISKMTLDGAAMTAEQLRDYGLLTPYGSVGYAMLDAYKKIASAVEPLFDPIYRLGFDDTEAVQIAKFLYNSKYNPYFADKNYKEEVNRLVLDTSVLEEHIFTLQDLYPDNTFLANLIVTNGKIGIVKDENTSSAVLQNDILDLYSAEQEIVEGYTTTDFIRDLLWHERLNDKTNYYNSYLEYFNPILEIEDFKSLNATIPNMLKDKLDSEFYSLKAINLLLKDFLPFKSTTEVLVVKDTATTKKANPIFINEADLAADTPTYMGSASEDRLSVAYHKNGKILLYIKVTNQTEIESLQKINPFYKNFWYLVSTEENQTVPSLLIGDTREAAIIALQSRVETAETSRREEEARQESNKQFAWLYNTDIVPYIPMPKDSSLGFEYYFHENERKRAIAWVLAKENPALKQKNMDSEINERSSRITDAEKEAYLTELNTAKIASLEAIKKAKEGISSSLSDYSNLTSSSIIDNNINNIISNEVIKLFQNSELKEDSAIKKSLSEVIALSNIIDFAKAKKIIESNFEQIKTLSKENVLLAYDNIINQSKQAFEAEKADLDNTIKEEQLKTNIDGLFKEQKVITENETMFDFNLHEKENLQSWFNLIQEHQNNFNLQELNDIFVKNKNLIQDNPMAMSFILESEFAIKQQENVSQRVNENQSQNLLIKC